MMMNYLELKQDTPVRLHFSDHYYVKRMIWDKDLGKEKPVESLVMWADSVDGGIAAQTFSVLSRKLYLQLSPYLPDSRFRDFDYVITKTGSGFETDYEVIAIPIQSQTPSVPG